MSVIQITDTHLCETPGGELMGVDTDASLQAVIDTVARERPRCDALLLTGDLSDHGSTAAYRRLRDYAAQLTANDFWLVGNHDDHQNMAAVVWQGAQLTPEIRVGKWQILMLNSQIRGEVGGELGEEELELLDQRLRGAASAGLHSLVCLHHQPVKVGCAWLDQQMVADAAALFEVIDRHSTVKGVLWGHVHQEVAQHHGDIPLLATPSSCVQFKPDSEDFAADDQAPGYRWLDLHPDGRISTGVSRVQEPVFTVDHDSGGYL